MGGETYRTSPLDDQWELYDLTDDPIEAINRWTDPELHELPGTCSHFVVDTDGTIHQLVSLTFMCRHTVGLNDTAHHGVREAGGPLSDHVTHELHGFVHGSVISHTRRENLMHTQPQGVAHGGLNTVDVTLGRHLNDGVVRAEAAQRAIREFGREPGVLRAEGLPTNRDGQRQVRVGI